MEQSTTALAPRGIDLGQPVIDVDIHCNVPSAQALFPYLSAHWREYVTYSAFKGPADTAYPGGAPTTALPGTRPEGGPPGSSLALVREQVLDPWNVEIGILNCSYAVESLHNPDTAAAMAAAVNDWMIHEWLGAEPRLRASIAGARRGCRRWRRRRSIGSAGTRASSRSTSGRLRGAVRPPSLLADLRGGRERTIWS